MGFTGGILYYYNGIKGDRQHREVLNIMDDLIDNRPVYTVMETAVLLGLGRNSTYEAITRGQIPSIRVGRRVLVPSAALEHMLAAANGRVSTSDS